MLIEQIIRIALMRLGPPGCTFTSKTEYFHDKTKIKSILKTSKTS